MNQQLLQSWLTLQCQAMPGTRTACARINPEKAETGQLNACWPGGEPAGAELTKLLDLADSSEGPVTSAPAEAKNNTPPVLRIAHPISSDGRKQGAIAIELTQVPRDQQAAVIRLIEWGNTWLDLLLKYDSNRENDAGPLPQAIQCVLQSGSLQEAGISLTGYLAHRYGCERVSLGLRKGNSVRLLTMSDSAQIPSRSELSRQLSAAMTEALSQSRPFSWPSDTQETMPAHSVLAEAEQDTCILTFPLQDAGNDFAALTFEFQNQTLNDSNWRKQLAGLANHLGPLLALKRAREMPLQARFQRERGSTSGHAAKKVKALLLTLLLACGIYFLGSQAAYRVSGSAQIEGEIQQALIAPFDGYVSAAHTRAGETVAAGDVLAELDDTELKLEQRQLSGERNELEKQYRKALAGLDHAQARILKAQIAQAEARIDLLQQTLGRTQLKAPFSGVVISGDLSRSLGKPVKRGELLMEIAPLAAYRVAIEIGDRDISSIVTGQTGLLILAARPSEKLKLEVVNITNMPNAGAKAGNFRVEARLQGAIDNLRPGMRGVAKIEAGNRSRIWIWTHEITEWFSYRLWAWLP